MLWIMLTHYGRPLTTHGDNGLNQPVIRPPQKYKSNRERTIYENTVLGMELQDTTLCCQVVLREGSQVIKFALLKCRLNDELQFLQ